MKTNNKGLDLIKSAEGLKLTGYLCPAKVPTVGYGHTGSEVHVGMKISLEQAEKLLVEDIEKRERQIDNTLKVILNQNQYSAVVSFVYNLGIGNLKTSTLLKLINGNPDDPNITAEFKKWNKAGGKVLPGLTKRREAEAKLYFSK